MKKLNFIIAIYAISLLSGCMCWKMRNQQEGTAPEVIVEAHKTKKWKTVKEAISFATINLAMTGSQFISGLDKSEIDVSYIESNEEHKDIPNKVIDKLVKMKSISEYNFNSNTKITFENRIQKVKNLDNKFLWTIELKKEKKVLLKQLIYIVIPKKK